MSVKCEIINGLRFNVSNFEVQIAKSMIDKRVQRCSSFSTHKKTLIIPVHGKL